MLLRRHSRLAAGSYLLRTDHCLVRRSQRQCTTTSTGDGLGGGEVSERNLDNVAYEVEAELAAFEATLRESKVASNNFMVGRRSIAASSGVVLDVDLAQERREAASTSQSSSAPLRTRSGKRRAGLGGGPVPPPPPPKPAKQPDPGQPGQPLPFPVAPSRPIPTQQQQQQRHPDGGSASQDFLMQAAAAAKQKATQAMQAAQVLQQQWTAPIPPAPKVNAFSPQYTAPVAPATPLEETKVLNPAGAISEIIANPSAMVPPHWPKELQEQTKKKKKPAERRPILDGSTQFEDVDDLDIDRESADQVAKYLRRAGQKGEVEHKMVQQHVGDGLYNQAHSAVLVFQIGGLLGVKAQGLARQKKYSIIACMMHALALIEHYTMHEGGAVHINRLTADQVSKLRETEPRPIRIISAAEKEKKPKAATAMPAAPSITPEDIWEKQVAVSYPLLPKIPSLPDQWGGLPKEGPLAPPGFYSLDNLDSPMGSRNTEDNAAQLQTAAAAPSPCSATSSLAEVEWRKYCESVSEYIQQTAMTMKMENYKKKDVVLIGHRMIDGAAIKAHAVPLHGQAIRKLTKHCAREGRATPKEWGSTLRVAQGVTMCRFPLPQNDLIICTGLGKNSEEARVRAAMHALEILSRLREQENSRHDTHRDNRHEDSKADAAVSAVQYRDLNAPAHAIDAPAVPVAPAGLQQDEAKSRLIELYTVCLGLPAPVCVSDLNRESGLYSSRVAVGDFQITSKGINKREAERNAFNSLYEELSLQDESFNDVIALLETHPHLDPEHLVKLDIPEDLRKEIGDLTDEAETAFPTQQQQIGVANHVDPSTVTLISRLKSAATDPSNEATSKNSPATGEEAPDSKQIRISALSAKMKRALEETHADPKWQEQFGDKKHRLAMTHHKTEFLRLCENNRVVIVCGTTGCGKTTQVPQFLLDQAIERGDGAGCRILVTQPRRISAVSIAERIAAERSQSVGGEVGYTIRLQSRPGTHINLCTTGVLVQLFSGDPSLPHIDYLIIDEIHERDLNCDFAFIMIKQLLQSNPSIRIILMSATLQSKTFSEYFGGAPVLNVEGSTFPVKELFLADIAKIAKKSNAGGQGYFQPSFLYSPAQELTPKEQKLQIKKQAKDIDYILIRSLVHYAVGAESLKGKSILVFLPGWKEILQAKRVLQGSSGSRNSLNPTGRLPAAQAGQVPDDGLDDDGIFHYVLLHSSVDSKEQQACFKPAPKGKYKVILSTNIAESGVTIDDVAVVIDTGTVKEMSWVLRTGTTNVGRGSNHGISTLVTNYCSQANATQRKGRAGRTQGGTCYRLYTKDHFDSLPPFQSPEMSRQPLDGIILRMLAMGYKDPKMLLRAAIDPPPVASVTASIDNLKAIGAVDFNLQLHPLGRWLTKLPTTPQVGKMILLGAILKCLDSVLTLAAAFEAEPFVQGKEVQKEMRQRKMDFSENSYSDTVSGVNAFNEFSAHGGRHDYCYMNYLNYTNLNNISKYKRQFYDILAGSGFLDKEQLAPTQIRRQQRNEGGHPIPFLEVSDYSKDAGNIALVKSVICAGLFPKVALQNTVRRASQKKKNEKMLRTKMHNHLLVGKGSCAYQPGSSEWDVTQCPYYVYDEIVLLADTNTEFLDGVTSANIWALLLLGASNSHIQYRDDLCLGVIDEWILFRSEAESVETILQLKRFFHNCLLQKFTDPGNVANNKRLDRMQVVCKRLFSTPLKPNDLSGAEWKQTGRIVNADPLDPVAFAASLELQKQKQAARQQKQSRPSTFSGTADSEVSSNAPGDFTAPSRKKAWRTSSQHGNGPSAAGFDRQLKHLVGDAVVETLEFEDSSADIDTIASLEVEEQQTFVAKSTSSAKTKQVVPFPPAFESQIVPGSVQQNQQLRDQNQQQQAPLGGRVQYEYVVGEEVVEEVPFAHSSVTGGASVIDPITGQEVRVLAEDDEEEIVEEFGNGLFGDSVAGVGESSNEP